MAMAVPFVREPHGLRSGEGIYGGRRQRTKTIGKYRRASVELGNFCDGMSLLEGMIW